MPRLLCPLCFALCFAASLHAGNAPKFVELKGFFCTFSPDGTKVITSPTAFPEAFQCWDLELGRELYTLEGGHVVFSPDSKKIIVYGAGNKVRIFDSASGREQKFEGYFAAFSPDGKKIAVRTGENSAILDADSGKELYKMEGNFSCFSPNEKKIVTMDNRTRTVRFWDIESGKELHKIEIPTKFIHYVVFSPDGKKMVTSSMDNTFHIWDLPTTLTEPPSEEGENKTADGGRQTAEIVSPLDLPPDANEEAELAALREKILAEERAKELALIEEERKIVPLVDDPDKLIPLDPQDRIWITPDRKSVVLLGRVVLREGFLELLACRVRSKEHESILSVRVKPQLVHAALLATNARQGRHAQFEPTFSPATGDRIDITLRWQSGDTVAGSWEEAPAQDWVWDMSSPEHAKKAMTTHWVFSGSRTYQNAEGKNVYVADETGELFGLSNFVGSILDVPIESSADNTKLQFGCFTERIPPLDTPVTIIVTPKK